MTSVVNAASREAGVAPGALATLFGANLAGGATTQAGFPWPASLGGVRVRLGDLELPLLYTSDGQINFYVPFGPPPGLGLITVVTPSGVSASASVSINDLQPGIFPGAVLRSGSGVSATANPVGAGDFLEIYCTGLGPTRPVAGLSVTSSTPTVFIGGIPVVPAYSGLAPGFTGLYQVNAKVPPGLAAGPQGVILTIGNTHSNEIRILLQ